MGFFTSIRDAITAPARATVNAVKAVAAGTSVGGAITHTTIGNTDVLHVGRVGLVVGGAVLAAPAAASALSGMGGLSGLASGAATAGKAMGTAQALLSITGHAPAQPGAPVQDMSYMQNDALIYPQQFQFAPPAQPQQAKPDRLPLIVAAGMGGLALLVLLTR